MRAPVELDRSALLARVAVDMAVRTVERRIERVADCRGMVVVGQHRVEVEQAQQAMPFAPFAWPE